MKLFMVGASPYARKVRASAVSLGLADRIEVIVANPHDRPPALLEVNPLSKVPTLVTDDGEAIFDSLCICDYLDDLSDKADLIPADRAERRDVLQRHAVAHGIMDCAVIRRLEGLRAKDADRDDWVARQEKTITRALDWYETRDDLDGPLTIDRITLAAALGFLDFRFPDDGWREGRPKLTAWQARMEELPPLAETRPF